MSCAVRSIAARAIADGRNAGHSVCAPSTSVPRSDGLAVRSAFIAGSWSSRATQTSGRARSRGVPDSAPSASRIVRDARVSARTSGEP
ncbi:hypothetical protein [Dactylosporangium cerinum]